MRQLMISLDKKILDPSSGVAKRMIEYGKMKELCIILPSASRTVFDLSSAVHVYTSGGSNKISQFIALYKLASRLCKEKSIEEVTAQDPFFTGLLGLWVSKKNKTPLEVQVHGDFFSPYYLSSFGSAFRILLASYILKKSTTIRTVSERVKASIVRSGISENKISVQPILLNLSNSNEHGVPESTDYFVWAGRMEKVKNLPFLVSVIESVKQQKPSVKLLLIGEGSEEEKLKQLVAEKTLGNNIKFLSWVSSPEKYLKNAKALLFPSLSESYGAVAMEAYELGTAVIMSDVGVANYELKPGSKVTILPINDKDAWVEAILKV